MVCACVCVCACACVRTLVCVRARTRVCVRVGTRVSARVRVRVRVLAFACACACAYYSMRGPVGACVQRNTLCAYLCSCLDNPSFSVPCHQSAESIPVGEVVTRAYLVIS